MTKFNIQDRVILDDMVAMFTDEMNKMQDKADLEGNRMIITREYWTHMLTELQEKIDGFTTKKALRQSISQREMTNV